MMAKITDFQSADNGLHEARFTFSSSEIGKLSLRLLMLFYLDNTPEIYFDNFFNVANELEKNK